MTEALYYEKSENKSVTCRLCPHTCKIGDGKIGICGVRKNNNGVLYAEAYGQISSVADDPVTKKPLYHFHPDKRILSIGSYGCNFRCPFCQNHAISMGKPRCNYIPPDEIASLALRHVPTGNIGVAYTYNEPFINYEYILDCAKLIKKNGMKNVLVTNGFISPEPLAEILPYIDAMNIDLKSFSDMFYKKIGGRLDSVKETIKSSIKSCHVEVTTLIIPGENDGEDEMAALAEWLGSLDNNCPLHLSRFFPRYKMTDRDMTPRETLDKLAAIARKYLKFVFLGNV